MCASVLLAVPANAAPSWLVTPSPSPAFAGDAPDPHVVRFGSTYYAYTTGTTWGNHIGVLKSSQPASGWQALGSALPTVPSWQQVDTQNAPGVFFWAGRYVMYYNAKPVFGPRRCLSVATSSTPQGPFVDNTAGPILCQDALGGAIDASPFVDTDGKAYLYWKNNDGFSPFSAAVSRVWVAPLSADGLQVAGPPQEVMAKDDSRPPGNTVDNPQMVRARGAYYLFFTGGDYLKASYAMGYAVCRTRAGPCTRPLPGPILSSYGSVAGPGGGSVFADTAGGFWLAYHAYAAPCPDVCAPPRRFFTAPMRQPFTWSTWERLSGDLVGDSAAESRTPNRLDVLARTTDGKVQRKQWNGSSWTAWNSLGGTPAGDPAVASWAPNRLDVFVRGTDGRLQRKWLNASGWSAWTQFAGTIAGDPAVASWGPNRLDVFVRGTNNQLQHKAWNGSSWTGWENLGGALKGTPAVVSRGAGLIDVFVRGSDNQLYTKWFNASGWSAWTQLGGALKGDPAVASWSVTRLDVFGRGTDDRPYQQVWSNGPWSGWRKLAGGVIAGDPAAVSWAAGRIDVFARGTDNQLLHKSFN
jgi:hypothetical protein